MNSVYPKTRPAGLPPSPLRHIRGQFEQVLRSPRRAEYYQIFSEATSQWKGDVARLTELCGRADQTIKTWDEISGLHLSSQTSLDRERLFAVSSADPIESHLIQAIALFIMHERTHSSPLATIQTALGAPGAYGGLDDLVPEWERIPDIAWPIFTRFFKDLDSHFAYYEQQAALGKAFFAPDHELSLMQRLNTSELEAFMEMQGNMFSLRFLGSNFDVVSSRAFSGNPKNHTFVYSVSPSLGEISLPLMILGPKIGCDTKNLMRVVNNREYKLEENLGGLSLSRRINGQELLIEPVVFNLHAEQYSPNTWGLVSFDNGKGIIVEELFAPVANARKSHPELFSPAINCAMERYENGDPSALNAIPYGDLFELTFHLGISVGSGSLGTGMGLWGSMALLTRIGAQIRVGITPKTGGFFQLITLPTSLSVPAKTVRKETEQIWRNFVVPESRKPDWNPLGLAA